ncbi:hypothetical protein KKC65_01725 [Patescibacteria group bacterium]|nr:hypothetical protein [Patescibacteria group bacterium]
MKNKKAHIVAVNMGYGHQRTAYPLRIFSPDEKVINANDYEGIPEKDKKVWESSRTFYEFISRFKRVSLIGNIAFATFNKFQQIPSFYPRRDLSKPTFGLKKIFSLIDKGWGEDLISKLSKNPLPIITSFFIPAFMAEEFNYPGEIYCVVSDADCSRAWAPLNPSRSKIKYFAPNLWVMNRLKLYGVKSENIFLTGFPLPLENIGTKKQEVVKKDLGARILNLDPEKRFHDKYKSFVDRSMKVSHNKKTHILSIMFAIGGAGAQKEMVMEYIKNLYDKIKKKEIKIYLSAGIRKEVSDYFTKSLKALKLQDNIGKNIEIIYEEDINKYFETFDKKLRKTDVLWTKPSELCFYSGLGVPILMAPTIGSQEDYNKNWLLGIGAGVPQINPKYASQWLFDYLDSGRFAEAALAGFIEVENMGTYNIEKICFG